MLVRVRDDCVTRRICANEIPGLDGVTVKHGRKVRRFLRNHHRTGHCREHEKDGGRESSGQCNDDDDNVERYA